MGRKTETYLSLIVCLVAGPGLAQPAVQDNRAMPTNGLAAAIGRAAGGAALGAPGPNKTWEFSALPYSTFGTVTVMDVVATPFQEIFPGSNYTWKLDLTGGGTGYTYMKVSGDKIEMLGDGVTSGTAGVDYTPDPQTTFKFPFQFGDSLSDSYGIKGGATQMMALKYDAYGTLKMPFGTYTGVIRVRQQFGVSAPNYLWYSTSPVFPLAIYSAAAQTLTGFAMPTTGIARMPKETWDISLRAGKGRLSVAWGPGPADQRMLSLIGLDGTSREYPLGPSGTLEIGGLAAGPRLYRIRAGGKSLAGMLRIE